MHIVKTVDIAWTLATHLTTQFTCFTSTKCTNTDAELWRCLLRYMILRGHLPLRRSLLLLSLLLVFTTVVFTTVVFTTSVFTTGLYYCCLYDACRCEGRNQACISSAAASQAACKAASQAACNAARKAAAIRPEFQAQQAA